MNVYHIITMIQIFVTTNQKTHQRSSGELSMTVRFKDNNNKMTQRKTIAQKQKNTVKIHSKIARQTCV